MVDVPFMGARPPDHERKEVADGLLMVAAQIWSYWLAPPLLATALALVVVIAVGYYRKVTVPRYLMQQERLLDQRRRQHTTAPVRVSTTVLQHPAHARPRPQTPRAA